METMERGERKKHREEGKLGLGKYAAGEENRR